MDPTRDPMIAVGMNDDPLPVEHGYPARLIVPGLYGYVSATKWLSEIELTTLEAFDAYWVPLGWAKEAPILTQSRIDVPRDGASRRGRSGDDRRCRLGARSRGVSKVEVRVDDGPWQPATLSTEIAKATWVQWRVPWTARPGDHTIQVRATDGTGPGPDRAVLATGAGRRPRLPHDPGPASADLPPTATRPDAPGRGAWIRTRDRPCIRRLLSPLSYSPAGTRC